ESCEICAMKEVTLFSDDAKSKESARQSGQMLQIWVKKTLGVPIADVVTAWIGGLYKVIWDLGSGI
ncbi:hypothetical protein Tco_1047555, partial [Tanacetum coccineum]